MSILHLSLPPVCRREILRYAACREETPQVKELLDSCLEELLPMLRGRACYEVLEVRQDENGVDLGAFCVASAGLARALQGCRRCVLMAATLGVEPDRLIARYGRIAPARAVMMQAIATERIEALCDAACEQISREAGMPLRPRFSPGYGDLPLETQRDVFGVLDCSRRIGLTLTESLLMAPSKSVTAFAGLGAQAPAIHKCSVCEQTDCPFRGDK